MSDGRDDESPPAPREARTPAERAGATPLDPERFKANAGMPVVQRQREIVGQVPVEDVPVEPVVRRRRSAGPAASPRRRGSGRGWLVAAAVLAVLGMAALVLAWVTEPDTEVAAAAPAELVAATPVLSARRAPELTVRPVAARNLRAAVEPVLAAAPPESCVQIRDGANALVSSNDAAALVPASNLKLVTSAAALALLDPASRFTTSVVTDGAPTDGRVVRGNLYLVGGGDPLLSTPEYLAQLPNGVQPSTELEALADQIVATGVREITGSVVGDGSRYDDVRTVAAWPERFVTQGQVAPLSALLVDDTWTAASGPGGDPDQRAAATLTQLLSERGVEVAGAPAAGTAPASAAPLTDIDSLTVAEIVDEGLRFSDNTTMELLVKEIGLQTSGTGSTEAGLAAIREWLASSGLPAEGVVLDDGSGLSEQNRVTCALLSSLLAEDGADGVIAAGLARPGEDGTLDDKLLAQDLRGRVRAKTGTLRPVTALSGWLRTVPERELAFAFVINRPGGQVTESDSALQEDLLQAMLAHPEQPDLAQLVPAPPVAGTS